MASDATAFPPAWVPLLGPDSVKISVSSTLDRSSSKKHLVDANDDTCWSSATPKDLTSPLASISPPSPFPGPVQPNSPTTITLAFPPPGIRPRLIEFTFQGGFVGRTVSVLYSTSPEPEWTWTPSTQVFPLDVNRKQSFPLPETDEIVHGIRLVFEDGSDLNYGRITLYHLQILGLYPPA